MVARLEVLERLKQALNQGEFKSIMEIVNFININTYQGAIKTRADELKKEFKIARMRSRERY
jgi:hypothetical protein